MFVRETTYTLEREIILIHLISVMCVALDNPIALLIFLHCRQVMDPRWLSNQQLIVIEVKIKIRLKNNKILPIDILKIAVLKEKTMIMIAMNIKHHMTILMMIGQDLMEKIIITIALTKRYHIFCLLYVYPLSLHILLYDIFKELNIDLLKYFQTKFYQ